MLEATPQADNTGTMGTGSSFLYKALYWSRSIRGVLIAALINHNDENLSDLVDLVSILFFSLVFETTTLVHPCQKSFRV
jgi:hypothetical protein